jgi:hypothetical protein
MSQAMLQQLGGGRTKPDCAGITNSGNRQAEIVGSLLSEEGLIVFEGFSFTSKIERHRTFIV